jgi:hypothetical protein
MATTSCNLNHISRLITALIPRSGPIDTELITMLFANMTIQMLRCYDIYPSSI